MSKETKYGFCKTRDLWIQKGERNKGAPGCCRRRRSKVCVGSECPAFEMRKPTRYLKRKLKLNQEAWETRRGLIL